MELGSRSLCLYIFQGLSLFLCFSHLLILCPTLSPHISNNHTRSYILPYSRSHMRTQSFFFSDPHSSETTCLIYSINKQLSIYIYRNEGTFKTYLCVSMPIKCFQCFAFVSLKFSGITFRPSQVRSGWSSGSQPDGQDTPRGPEIILSGHQMIKGIRTLLLWDTISPFQTSEKSFKSKKIQE